MSRIVIVILIYNRHKPVDSINLLDLHDTKYYSLWETYWYFDNYELNKRKENIKCLN
jgi:hypothetical protein